MAGAGLVDNRHAVDFRLLGKVVCTWIVTLPVAGGLSAVTYLIVRAAL